MDSPPPTTSHRSEPRIRTKSSSRLARTNAQSEEPTTMPHLSLDLVSYSQTKKENTPPSTLSPNHPLSLHELLRLSPSPLRKSSKTRLLELGDDPVEPNGSRRRCKSRNANVGCASPRNSRRLRRRLEQDIREERDLVMVDEIVNNNNNKPRKRRSSGRSKKDKLVISSSCPSIPSPKGNDGDGCNFDRIGQLINDLIMWNDVAKSSLWFGIGSLCFLSSCFSRGVSFSMFSAISQLGLLLLGVSFFSNSIAQRNRNSIESKSEFKLKEEDILRAAILILPAANLAISKRRELFSGEPSMTLKVAPLLLVGAEYGHLITLRRLFALGFFISFTGPKLYSSYSVQINKKVEYLKRLVMEAWGACSHKKIVAASAVTAFWNLTTLKTRIFAAFISLVIVRYYRQNIPAKVEEGDQEQQ